MDKVMYSYFSVKMNNKGCVSGQKEYQLDRDGLVEGDQRFWMIVYFLKYVSLV